MTFDLGIFGSIQKNRLLPSQWKLFYSAATFNPTLPAGRNSDGEYETVPEALWISNPTALIDMQEDEENAHFNAHLKAKVDVGYGVTMTAFGSYSYYMGNNAHYYPTYVWSHGEAYRANMRNEGILGNVTIDKRFDITSSQHLSLLAMAERQSQLMKGFNVTTTSFTTDAYGYENISAGAVSPWEGIDSYREDAHLESFMLRGKYTIKDRYSLTKNARLDGSSKVGRNNHWGFFPSAAAAWIVSDEKWMKPLTWLSLMKIRAGCCQQPGHHNRLFRTDAHDQLQCCELYAGRRRQEFVPRLPFLFNGNKLKILTDYEALPILQHQHTIADRLLARRGAQRPDT